MNPSSFSSFDPFDPDHLADPYPMLARIREATPALWIEKHRFFLLTRYADVVAASKRYDVFSSTGGVGIEWKPRPMMPMYDPPEHTKLRRMVAPFFQPREVLAWSPAIRRAAESAVERALASDDGVIDVIRDLAEPMSLITLATVLGIPPDRRADLRRWADSTMAELAGGVASENEAAAIEATRKELVRYLREVIAERRTRGGEDLISVLVRANEGDSLSLEGLRSASATRALPALSEKEVVAFCVLLLVAGFEPSASAIGNVCQALARNVPRLDDLGSSPTELATNADELLRFDSSVHAFFRNTKEDTRVGAVDVPKDTKVMLHFAAANRDPTVFSDPDRMDLGRAPNPHIAFGAGPHHCLGAPLARVQLTTLLAVLKSKVARLEETEPGVRHDNLLFHGMKRCRLRFVPR